MQGYEKIDYIFVDIETIPGKSNFEELPTEEDFIKTHNKTKEQLKLEVPKSYKKQETIDKWIDDEYDKQDSNLKEEYQKLIDDHDKEYRKQSLDSLKGELFCVGIAFNDEEPACVTYSPNEEHMLEKLLAWLENEVGDRKMATVCWVGHNVQGFDMRWIAQRAMKYGLYKLLRYLPIEKWSKRMLDTNAMFNINAYGKYNHLDDIAKFFGLQGKEGMSGGEVYDYYLDKKFDEIYEYCKNDVVVTREIFKKITGYTL